MSKNRQVSVKLAYKTALNASDLKKSRIILKCLIVVLN